MATVPDGEHRTPEGCLLESSVGNDIRLILGMLANRRLAKDFDCTSFCL